MAINPALFPAGLMNMVAGGGLAGPPPVAPTPSPAGLFGLRGNARDILGTLGDAMLIHTGNNPLYTPQKRNEQLGQAMQGFVDNPLAAIKEMAGAGFGEQAREAYNDFLKNRIEESKAKATIASQTATAENARARTRNENLDYEGSVNQQIANRLGTINWDNPAQVAAARDWAMKYAENKGVGLRIPMPEQLTQDYATSLRESFVSPKDRAQIEGLEAYRDASIGVRKQGLRDLSDYRGKRLNQIDRAQSLDEAEFMFDQMDDDESSAPAVTPSPPPYSPAQYKGRTLSGPGGTWTSDGKRWTRKS